MIQYAGNGGAVDFRAAGATNRSKCLGTSAMALVAAVLACTGAQAQSVDLTSANNGLYIDGTSSTSFPHVGNGTAVNVTGGTAYLFAVGYNHYVSPYAGDGFSCPCSPSSNPSLWSTYNLNSANLYLQSNNDGWLQAGSGGGAASVNVAQGATLEVLGSADLYNVINANGNLVLGGPAVNLSGTTTVLGNLSILPGTAASFGYNGWWLNVDLTLGNSTNGGSTNISMGSGSSLNLYLVNTSYAGETVVMDGALSSADKTAAVTISAGTLVVNGANTAANPFTGTINLTNANEWVGSLVVGDSSHRGAILGDPSNPVGTPMTINVGSQTSLMGYGTIDGKVVVQSGGNVYAGGSGFGASATPGFLSVGSYTQEKGGVLNVAISPTGISGLHSAGPVDFQGGILNIVSAPGNYGTAVYTFLTGSSVSGLSNLTIDAPAGGNGAIIGLNQTATSLSIVSESASTAQLYAHLYQAQRDNILSFQTSLFEEIQPDLPPEQAAKTVFANGDSVWLQPDGRVSSLFHGGVGYVTSSGGLIGGYEHRVSDRFTYGIVASYDNAFLDTEHGESSATTNSYNVAVYGGAELKYGRLDADLFKNFSSSRGTRGDLFAADSGSAIGTESTKPQGGAWGGALQLTHGFSDNLVVPYLRGSYIKEIQENVTETGSNSDAAGLALAMNRIARQDFTADVGVHIHPTFPFADGARLRPIITLGVTHDFSLTGEEIAGQFANTLSRPMFIYDWKGNRSTSAVAGLRLATDVGHGVEMFGSFDGKANSVGQEGRVNFGVRYVF